LENIKIGFSQMIFSLSRSIFGILMRKLLVNSSSDEEALNNLVAGFNVFINIFQIS
jgi:hypothetical protein